MMFQSDNPLLVGIQSSFRCPRCTWDSQIISARKIEPLSRISSQLQERLRVWQEIMQKRIDLQQRVEVIDLKSGFELKPRAMTISNCPSPALPRFGGAHSNFSSPNLSIAATISPRSPMFQLTDVDDLPEVVTESAPPISPRPESLFSKYSESDSTSLTPKNSSRRQYTWQSLFKPSRSMSSVLSLPKCAFFASGRTLLLWNQRGLGFYDFSHVESVVFRRVISCNVQVAAGGTNQFAIVSKIERVSNQIYIISWLLTTR